MRKLFLIIHVGLSEDNVVLYTDLADHELGRMTDNGFIYDSVVVAYLMHHRIGNITGGIRISSPVEIDFSHDPSNVHITTILYREKLYESNYYDCQAPTQAIQKGRNGLRRVR